MSRNLPLLGKTHPLTGEPIRAIGWRPNGEPLWPIMGGDPSNDPPERPEDVSEEEWNALGDPGKQAIHRERTKRVEAERALQAARAKPAPPKVTPPSPTPPAPKVTDDTTDVAKLVQDAVAAAMKPFAEAEQQRQTQELAGKVVSAVTAAAKGRFADPSDAPLNIDLTSVVNEQGEADEAKIKTALDAVLEKKPHLAQGPRTAPSWLGGTPNAGGEVPLADRVKNTLAEMQRATGVRVPTSN